MQVRTPQRRLKRLSNSFIGSFYAIIHNVGLFKQLFDILVTLNNGKPNDLNDHVIRKDHSGYPDYITK